MPESVSKSMRTSSARSLNRLYPACSRRVRRSSNVVMCSCSVICRIEDLQLRVKSLMLAEAKARASGTHLHSERLDDRPNGMTSDLMLSTVKSASLILLHRPLHGCSILEVRHTEKADTARASCRRRQACTLAKAARGDRHPLKSFGDTRTKIPAEEGQVLAV